MEALWLVRYNNQYGAFGGRVLIGYCGWHKSAASAYAEAHKRFPDIDPASMAIERA